MNDLVIHGALIVDGSGSEPTIGDVAVRDGVITAVCQPGLTAAEVVDADGLVLAPGIVDIHTHYDAQLTWDAGASPSPQMGVTTVVVGNCGFGLAPCHPDHRDLTLKNLTKVEGMPLDALLRGVNWEFETFGEYLDLLAARGVVPNVAALANHSCIRTYVMGIDAAFRTERAPSSGVPHAAGPGPPGRCVRLYGCVCRSHVSWSGTLWSGDPVSRDYGFQSP